MNETKFKLKAFTKDLNINSNVLSEMLSSLSKTEITTVFELLPYINKDNVKTKVNIINTSKNDTDVTINVTGNNKKSIKEEFSVDKLSKKEVSIDLLKDISKIDDKNKKIESGVLDVKSDNLM